MTVSAVYLDIDRTISPIEDLTTWPDYSWVTGGPFPSIAVSPTLLTRIGQLPAELYYLTDWAPEDSQFFNTYLGRTASHLPRHTTHKFTWWKLDVLDAHLETRPDIERILFADDKLSEADENGFPYGDSVRAILDRHNVTGKLITTRDGIARDDLTDIERFLSS